MTARISRGISVFGLFRRGGRPLGAYLASAVGVTERSSQHVDDGVLHAATFGLVVGDGGVVRTVPSTAPRRQELFGVASGPLRRSWPGAGRSPRSPRRPGCARGGHRRTRRRAGPPAAAGHARRLGGLAIIGERHQSASAGHVPPAFLPCGGCLVPLPVRAARLRCRAQRAISRRPTAHRRAFHPSCRLARGQWGAVLEGDRVATLPDSDQSARNPARRDRQPGQVLADGPHRGRRQK